MEKERVVQFNIKGSGLTYGVKLTYNDSRVLEGFQLLEVRRNDRSVDLSMLTQQEADAFINHYTDKMSNLPISL